MAKQITQLEAFWQEVNEEKARLLARMHTSDWPEGQPTDEKSLFLTSISNRDRGSNPSFVVEAEVKLGAQRIREGTHRVSTAQEIKAYHDDQARRSADRHTAAVEKLVNTHEAAHVAAGRLQQAAALAADRVKTQLDPNLMDSQTLEALTQPS